MNRLKPTLLTLLMAVALLLAAPLLAQETGNTANEEQERTRSHHESWGPGQGLTMVGTVVSWDDDAMKVETTTGIENVVLTQQTRMALDLKKGMRVAVDYNRNTQGAIIAAQVRPGDVKGVERKEGTGNVEVRQHRTDTAPDTVLVGTVARVDEEQVVLLTSVGERTVLLTPATVRTVTYKVGDPIAIDYRMSGDDMVAHRVRTMSNSESETMKNGNNRGDRDDRGDRGDRSDRNR